jgi:predicted ATPase
MTNNSSSKNIPLMVIGCYRSNEVDGTHLLSTMLRDLRSTAGVLSLQQQQGNVVGFHLTEISLGNLELSETNCILMDLLSVDDETKTQGLADICHRRTNGNPFFFIAFVSMLTEKGLLQYNFGRMRWTWIDAAVEAKTVATTNVVDLIKTKITTQLRKEVRRILQLAACLGTSFEERLISVLWEELYLDDTPSSSLSLINKNPQELLEDAIK